MLPPPLRSTARPGLTPNRFRPRLRVLLAEDDEGIREGFGLYLRTVGLDVCTAADGPEALHLARKGQPDVIVLDGRMPGLSGQEVIGILRASPATAGIPIVLLTGMLEPGQSMPDQCGAEAALLKPCAPEALLAVIRRLGGRA